MALPALQGHSPCQCDRGAGAVGHGGAWRTDVLFEEETIMRAGATARRGVGVAHMPCTWQTWGRSPDSHRVPRALPEVRWQLLSPEPIVISQHRQCRPKRREMRMSHLGLGSEGSLSRDVARECRDHASSRRCPGEMLQTRALGWGATGASRTQAYS